MFFYLIFQLIYILFYSVSDKVVSTRQVSLIKYIRISLSLFYFSSLERLHIFNDIACRAFILVYAGGPSPHGSFIVHLSGWDYHGRSR